MPTFQAPHSKDKIIGLVNEMFDAGRIERAARETFFVRRARTIGAADFLFLCMFACQGACDASLQWLCGDLMAHGRCVSKQSLHDRFNARAVAFMKELFLYALATKLDIPCPKRNGFGRVVVGDSTTIELPEGLRGSYRGFGGSASGAAVKLQYSYDLLSQGDVSLLVQDGSCGDSGQPLVDLREGDLRIEDLGYFALGRFEQVMHAGAFFLSRLRLDTKVYTERDGTYVPLDLASELCHMRPCEPRSLTAYLGAAKKLKVRLVIERVPDAVAGEKRRKLRKYMGWKQKGLTQKRLALCSVNAHITNATEEQLPTDEVRGYYSLRWQVEITFKAWKSVFGIDRVGRMKTERFECMHYASLMLILLTTRLFAFGSSWYLGKGGKEPSMLKFFQIIKAAAPRIRNALQNDRGLLPALIEGLLESVGRIGLKQQKRGRASPYAILKIT